MRGGVNPMERYSSFSERHELWGKCDSCDWFWPERRLVRQDDGVVRCLDNCAYPRTVLGKEKLFAQLEKRVSQMEAQTREPRFASRFEMVGIPSCTSVNAGVLPVALSRGGAAVGVVLGGNNMTVADVISYTLEGGITTSVVDAVAPSFAASGLTATLSVSAPGGAVPGDYDLEYNGDTFNNVFRVR